MAFANRLDHNDALSACRRTTNDDEIRLLNDVCFSFTCREPINGASLSRARRLMSRLLGDGNNDLVNAALGAAALATSAPVQKGHDEPGAEFFVANENVGCVLFPDCDRHISVTITSGQNAGRKFIVGVQRDGFVFAGRKFNTLKQACGSFVPVPKPY